MMITDILSLESSPARLRYSDENFDKHLAQRVQASHFKDIYLHLNSQYCTFGQPCTLKNNKQQEFVDEDSKIYICNSIEKYISSL